MRIKEAIKTLMSQESQAVIPGIIYTSNNSPITAEQFKSTVDDSKSMLQSQVKGAIDHPFEFSTTLDLYKKFGLVTAIIDKYVDFIVGKGFRATSEDPRVQAIIEQFMHDHNFDSLLRTWIKEALITGNGFVELAGVKSKAPTEMKVLSSKNIYLVRDSTGMITNYYQYNPKTLGKEPVKFATYEIAHLPINRVGDDAYGVGIIYPMLEALDSFIKCRKDMHKILSRKANNQVHVKIGSVEKGIMPTPEAVTQFGKKLEYMNEKTEWCTDPYVEMKVLDFGNIGDKFTSILEHDLEIISVSSQIPEVLLGYGNIPEGLAREQKEAFILRAQSFQAEIQHVIEDEIFRRVIEGNGFTTHVSFEWGQPNEQRRNEEIIRLTEILKLFTLTPTVRNAAEERLAKLLELDVEEIPEEEKKRQDEQPLPKVPGQESIHECLHEDFETDYELKEWVNYNYLEMKQFILAAIKKDPFINLAASDQYEENLGYLTKPQIEELRKIMHDAFEEGKSVNKIAHEIKTKVQPPDLVVTDKNLKPLYDDEGNLRKVDSNVRNYMIARSETVRLASEGTLDNYKANDIEMCEWMADYTSERTCDDCIAMNAKVMSVDEARGQLPLHPGCRCSFLPVIASEVKK